MELFLIVEKNIRKKWCHKVQLGRLRLDTRRKTCHSKGSVMVQCTTQKESGSAQGFWFQGRAREESEISVKEERCSGESKVYIE